MKWLTLEQIKQQLRIESWQTAEDKLLTSYGESAEETLLNYLNRPYQEVIETWGNIPVPLVQASLMLVDVSYQFRSPISVTNISLVPYTFDILVKPYMRLASAESGEPTMFTLGSDVKILVDAELPDGFTMQDVDFTVTVYNADKTDKQHVYDKSECIETEGGNYVVLVDSDELGVGSYMVKVVFKIPDTDYLSGFRKQAVRINPNIRVNG